MNEPFLNISLITKVDKSNLLALNLSQRDGASAKNIQAQGKTKIINMSAFLDSFNLAKKWKDFRVNKRTRLSQRFRQIRVNNMHRTIQSKVPWSERTNQLFAQNQFSSPSQENSKLFEFLSRFFVVTASIKVKSQIYRRLTLDSS